MSSFERVPRRGGNVSSEIYFYKDFHGKEGSLWSIIPTRKLLNHLLNAIDAFQ
jgi:hypothetical protein